ncbi:hypothetical protein [Methylovirgula sp. 4M-Z18]|uniref:hypothetical protein n=1 Tax=Methylovirgula sp. 4M-Z18 TaxID=2293567 RepID=UPI000E2FA9F6|nr:hypothetical protein [Methylovirgula sp. 4M-Z18]RFB76700.1 hypothetical protein DYH55_19815 [Methylovirgula sp. 4M-Z18]
MEPSIQIDQVKLEELIVRVKEGEGRDQALDCEIAISLQYVPDAMAKFSNVRAHPTSRYSMLYDSPIREGATTFIPLLTSSLDAVEKLRAWGVANWIIDVLHVRNGEYIVRAASDTGATIQATARTEARARLASVLQAFKQPRD